MRKNDAPTARRIVAGLALGAILATGAALPAAAAADGKPGASQKAPVRKVLDLNRKVLDINKHAR